MGNVFKAAFRGSAATTTATLYTVPAGAALLVTSIVVTNTSAAAATYSMDIDGVSIATDVPVAGNGSLIIDPRTVVESGGVISGKASATTVKFHISGLEASP